VQFQRKEKPLRQKKYQNYKSYLRKDFLYRCAYCLIHEGHYGGLRNFHVDHFRPKKKYPRLALAYANLYYACGLCNTFKGDAWPSAKEIEAGFRFVDPSAENPYEIHFQLNETDGSLRALTDAGRYSSAHLLLDREQLRKHRQRQIEKRAKWNEVSELLNAPSLDLEWVARARAVMAEIEREYLDPAPPYEVEDLKGTTTQ
jgi:uncharacterized protein (TIGR02646 family)